MDRSVVIHYKCYNVHDSLTVDTTQQIAEARVYLLLGTQLLPCNSDSITKLIPVPMFITAKSFSNSSCKIKSRVTDTCSDKMYIYTYILNS